jgi:DnaA N-terminal domain
MPEATVSHAAIAAVLARHELATGERLVAWSLASFANREQLAWPGIPAAAGRAGLSRSRYMEVREQLVCRGLLDVETAGVGRGQASTVRLLFAQSGPWWECEVNVELAEAVLGYSTARGPARLLLATLAALSDESGVVEGVATEELCRAAGLANSTYRRARAVLLASGEVTVDGDSGGRGRTCQWTIRRPAELGAEPVVGRKRRVPLRPGARALVAAAKPDVGAGVENGPIVSGVSARKGPIPSGVSNGKGPILSGVSQANPAKTPPETPPPNARAGREPLNPRTQDPPNPPQGGASTDTRIFIEETHRSERGRLRRRRVPVDVEATCAGFRTPAIPDVVDWKRIRELLAASVGESMFAIWLEPLELRAVDASHALIVDAPDATRSWLRERFRRMICEAADQVGRQVLVADEAQSQSMRALSFDRVEVMAAASDAESSDASSCSSAYASYSSSACALSYTSAYNQPKEARPW